MEARDLLGKLRKKIDAIDFEILKLVNQRMEHTLRTRKLKANIADPGREQEIMAGIRRRSNALVGPDFSEHLFKVIINESKLGGGGGGGGGPKSAAYSMFRIC